MSKLSKFLGAPQIVSVCGETFEIMPLKVKDMHLFVADKVTPEQNLEISKKIIKLSLIGSMPDMTDEEIDNMSVEMFTSLMQAINKVNEIGGSENESGIRKIKEKIAQVQSAKS